MNWFVVGDEISATYDVPRPGLEKAGIKNGSFLFKGIYDGPGITGQAFVYKAGCAPASYEVFGREMEGTGMIVLRGAAPVRAKNGCDVVRYSATSPNAELVFSHVTTHH